MALKFYANVAKGLKLRLKVLEANSYTFLEVTGEKLDWGSF